MAKYQPQMPAPDIAYARSWIGKVIRDTSLQQLGIVHDVKETKDGIRLIARFPDQKRNRRIALEPIENMEYIYPGDVYARYRPPTEADQDLVKAILAKHASSD